MSERIEKSDLYFIEGLIPDTFLIRIDKGEKIDINVMRHFASDYFDEKDYVSAIQVYKKICEDTSATAVDFYNLALSYEKSNNEFLAIVAYKASIELNNNDDDSLSKLAKLLLDEGKSQMALELFEKAIVINSNNEIAGKYIKKIRTKIGVNAKKFDYTDETTEEESPGEILTHPLDNSQEGEKLVVNDDDIDISLDSVISDFYKMIINEENIQYIRDVFGNYVWGDDLAQICKLNNNEDSDKSKIRNHLINAKYTFESWLKENNDIDNNKKKIASAVKYFITKEIERTNNDKTNIIESSVIFGRIE